MLGPYRAVSVVAAVVSVLLIAASAWIAIDSQDWKPADRIAWGKAVVGLWVILPPVWFWAEWTFLSFGLGRDRLEDLKHSQELSRNIWVAAVVLLAVIFGIPWPA